ncbi:YbjN domain-containing protein [Stakelama marina]|uniref:YbjN domain-containing protein n=1 Tax=Stakelama marina TaxID=2826939 RepID=A0A8T4IA94_9SPHN|nr:YbjN domain-containing protein [Stakelama marina]MBR0551460.1 YbjN domain-containing protein [Stakelama marina]
MIKAAILAGAAMSLLCQPVTALAAARGQNTAVARPVREPRNITADPNKIAEILRAYGFKPQISQSSNGDPYIAIANSGTRFLIFFNNCVEGQNCTTIQFYAGFSTDTPPPWKLINQWNRDNRFAKAYIDDENDPRLEMDMNLNEGGIARSNFVSNFLIWLRLLNAFKTHIGWEK